MVSAVWKTSRATVVRIRRPHLGIADSEIIYNRVRANNRTPVQFLVATEVQGFALSLKAM